VTIGITLFAYPVIAKLLRKTIAQVFFSGFTAAMLIFYVYLLYFFFNYPTSRIFKFRKAVSRELVFAGRFLIIELESGLPVYDAFVHVSANYRNVGKYFQNIVHKASLGTDLETAIEQEAEIVPSQDLKKILWQVLNSIKTGADISDALNTVLDQLVREQQVEVEEYGRKLSPMAMFYMIFAVILPSLGMTMFMVLATFIGFKLDLISLVVIAAVLGFVQFLFLASIKSARPASGED
jgi:flagellar protein FlaJ